MLSALLDFTATYGADRVEIVKGESVVENHELARRFPQNFTTAPAFPGSAQGRPRRRGRIPAAPSAGLSSKLVFTATAWAQLHREVEEYCDGREAGGGLYGSVEEDGSIVVREVSAGCDWMERSTKLGFLGKGGKPAAGPGSGPGKAIDA